MVVPAKIRVIGGYDTVPARLFARTGFGWERFRDIREKSGKQGKEAKGRRSVGQQRDDAARDRNVRSTSGRADERKRRAGEA